MEPDSVATQEAQAAAVAEAPKRIKKSSGRPLTAKGAAKPQAPRAKKLAEKRANPDPVTVDWSKWEKVLVPIDQIDTTGRFRKVYHKIPELWESIQKVGQLQPCLVGPADPKTGVRSLIAGGRRVEALKHGGQTHVVCVEADYGADPDKALELFLNAELEENEQREPFSFEERMALIHTIEEKFKSSGKGKAGDKPRREKVAAVVQMSHESIRQAKAVEAAAKEDPEKFGDLIDNLRKSETTVKQAFKEMKKRMTPLFDAAGLALPDTPKATDPFSALPAYSDLIAAAQKVRSAFNDVANSPAGQALVMSGRLKTRTSDDKVHYSFDGLDDLIRLLKQHKPYSQCPTCAEEQGQLGKYGKSCPSCGGCGYVGEKQLDDLADAKDPSVATLKKLAAELKKSRDSE